MGGSGGANTCLDDSIAEESEVESGHRDDLHGIPRSDSDDSEDELPEMCQAEDDEVDGEATFVLELELGRAAR
jgi:hypothetical protein